jgi:hypothetical protein
MQNENSINSILVAPKGTPWNKGKLIGAKPPLLARHVWSIRTKLQIERRTRDLAMFNLAIDSKLRGCDIVAMKVEDVAPNGYAVARATVRQKKTGRPVRFELTEHTRQALDDYLRAGKQRDWEISVHQPATARRTHDTTAVCAARREMDCGHRIGPARLQHSLAPPHEGDIDLPSHWQPSCRLALLGIRGSKTSEVGMFEPNAFGLYDMAGNVWQWVQDCYHSDYDGAPTDGSAWITGGDCERRVVRGGAFDSTHDDLYSHVRSRYLAKTRLISLGFRVGRTLNP